MMSYIQKINIIGLTFLFTVLFFGKGVFAAPGDVVSPLIHVGAGDQVASKIHLGSSVNVGALFESNEPGTNSVFDGSTLSATDANASIFTVLLNAWFQNRLFVGSNNVTFLQNPLNSSGTSTATGQSSSVLSLWNTNFAQAGVADLQKINIFGGLISTDFDINSGNTGGAQVCVDASGTLLQCS